MPLVVDEVNTTLTDRELLLLVNERLTALNSKVDELRIDNAGKYEKLNGELKDLRDDYNQDMGTIKQQFSMCKGGMFAISIIFTIVQFLVANHVI